MAQPEITQPQHSLEEMALLKGLSQSSLQQVKGTLREALELGVDIPRDSRAPALVFITAVHSASPEYNFEVFEYLPEETVIRVFGFSRYDRIAKKLNIERHLTWPELIPFFEGVAEEVGVTCKVEGELKELGEEGRYECIYRFAL